MAEANSEWSFRPDETIVERHEQFAPGGVPLGKNEYTIKRRLRDEASDERFYHVETGDGGTHLYAASAIEHTYVVAEEVDER